MPEKYDFSGWASKADIKCGDGRVIKRDAFKECDGQTVPMVWHHIHDDPENVLGHAVLENRAEGLYAYGYFNDSPKGKIAKHLVEHGDITSLSVFANKLIQKGSDVVHGVVRELSLVLAGANSGAKIDNLIIQHSDGSSYESADEAIFILGEALSTEEAIEHAEGDKTLQEVFDTLSEEQKTAVYAMLAAAVDGGMAQSDMEEGGEVMKVNAFEGKEKDTKENTLTHDALRSIIQEAKDNKVDSLKDAVLKHAGTYGIDNIEVLFPDARNVTNPPEFVKRDDSWVQGVLSGTRHTPFSRVKSITADITADEARAKGYIKGTQKKEEVFPVMTRQTSPTTIYKKQKLDRDDIIDITDFDVVAWLRTEMRMMLDEEIARAVLIGDGRAVDNPDKIKDGSTDGVGVRPIYTDADFYSIKVTLPADITPQDSIDAILKAHIDYEGSGAPVFYTTKSALIDMLLVRDAMGRRLYNTETELATALGVSRIVSSVDVMKGVSRVVGANTLDLIGISVNLRDYVIGADRGGQVAMFDDFDIDFNQYKYLLETRISGALVRHNSAIVIEKIRAAG